MGFWTDRESRRLRTGPTRRILTFQSLTIQYSCSPPSYLYCIHKTEQPLKLRLSTLLYSTITSTMDSSQESGALKAALNILRNTPASDADQVCHLFCHSTIIATFACHSFSGLTSSFLRFHVPLLLYRIVLVSKSSCLPTRTLSTNSRTTHLFPCKPLRMLLPVNHMFCLPSIFYPMAHIVLLPLIVIAWKDMPMNCGIHTHICITARLPSDLSICCPKLHYYRHVFCCRTT